jgi:hypothetical protein
MLHGQGWLRVQNRVANDTSLPVLGLAALRLIMIFTQNDVFTITHTSYHEFSSRSGIYHISGMKEKLPLFRYCGRRLRLCCHLVLFAVSCRDEFKEVWGPDRNEPLQE